jgi:hypothetical protein
MDNAQRDRLISNVVGHLTKGVSEPVLARAFDYWRNIDQAVGDQIAKGIGQRMAANSFRSLRQAEKSIVVLRPTVRKDAPVQGPGRLIWLGSTSVRPPEFEHAVWCCNPPAFTPAARQIARSRVN